MASGNLSSLQDYASAAVGGAVGGELLLYIGPVGAGAAGALAGNVTKQGLNVLSGKQCSFNVASALTDTAVGAVGGKLSGWAWSGVNAGRGSFNSIYKQIVTKANNGTISSITPTTAAKMFAGRNWDQGTLPSTALSFLAGQAEAALSNGNGNCGCK